MNLRDKYRRAFTADDPPPAAAGDRDVAELEAQMDEIAEQATARLAAWSPPTAEQQAWTAWRAEQAWRAIAYLAANPHPDATTRAARILTAMPGDSPTRCVYGIAAADPALYGTKVKCGGCSRQYVCQPEDDYYDAADLMARTGGRCFACALRPVVPPEQPPVPVDAVDVLAGPAALPHRAMPAITRGQARIKSIDTTAGDDPAYD